MAARFFSARLRARTTGASYDGDAAGAVRSALSTRVLFTREARARTGHVLHSADLIHARLASRGGEMGRAAA